MRTHSHNEGPDGIIYRRPTQEHCNASKRKSVPLDDRTARKLAHHATADEP
jgi:hypothetical protein